MNKLLLSLFELVFLKHFKALISNVNGIKSFIVLSTVLFSSLVCYAQLETHFVTTWKTDNIGTSNNSSITIPTFGNNYDYDVDWDNDGTFDEFGLTGNVTHDFGVAGTYTIRIRRDFPRIYFNSLFSPTADELKIISVDQWGNEQWSSMESAFRGCKNLEINALDAPDLTFVIDMDRMFMGCETLNQDISHWVVSAVQEMESLFLDAVSFNQPLNSWDVSSVVNMKSMFEEANSFNQDISSWDVSSVTDMESMFYDAHLFNQPIGGWDVSSVEDMKEMFREVYVFNQPIGDWDVSSVTDMTFMFQEAYVFNQPIGAWDVSNVNSMYRMFLRAYAFNRPVGAWDVSSVTDMNEMFSQAIVFNQPINDWEVYSVTNMRRMFNAATNFNQPINSWDVSSVVTMEHMFGSALSFNQPIDDWDVSNVQYMNGMFQNADAFDQNINSWNVSNVLTMQAMFAGTAIYNQPLDNWNTSSVLDMSSMFNGALIFNQPLFDSVPSVTNMYRMFVSAFVFNQDLSIWDVSNVNDMRDMFKNASLFDQNIGAWNVESLNQADDMFTNSGLSINNYDSLLIGWNQIDPGEGELISDVTFGGYANYCLGLNARNNLTGSMINWDISDAGLFCYDCPILEANIGDNCDDEDSNTENDIVLSDCSCAGTPILTENNALDCSDGIDNDGDGLIDCDDPECDALSALGCQKCFSGLSFADSVIVYEDNCTVNPTDDPYQAVGAADWTFSNGTGFVSLGEGGSIELGFTNNTLTNSGDSQPDLHIFQVEGSATFIVGYMPANQETLDYIEGVGYIDDDSDGYFVLTNSIFPTLTSTINIDGYFFFPDPQSLMFSAIKIIDVDGSCGDLPNPGADIDAICAASSVPCAVGLSCDDGDANTENDIVDENCNCIGTPINTENDEFTCSDGIDNDGDNLIDCEDPDCLNILTTCDSFITSWNTELSGSSGNSSITFPLVPSFSYDFTIDWGDSTTPETFVGNGTQAGLLHSYSEPGIYTVTVTGDFRRFRGDMTGDQKKLVDVIQWGTNEWVSMQHSFRNCSNVQVSATDYPNLANFCNFYGMFAGATSFNSDIGFWDVSNVYNTCYMFYNCGEFNQDLNDWDVSGVINMSYMFFQATDFNGQISNWRTENVTDMASMFQSCINFNRDISYNSATGSWDVGGVKSMRKMFSGAEEFNQDISNWDVANVKDMYRTFLFAKKFNQPIGNWDVGNVLGMREMFRFAFAFDQPLGNWDISKVEDMSLFLQYGMLSTANYDQTLIGWVNNANGILEDVNFHGGNSNYCNSIYHREHLIDNEMWSIVDGGVDTGCTLPDPIPTTRVQRQFCDGSATYSLSQLIYAEIVSGAEQYEWTFDDGSNVIVHQTNSYPLLLFQVPGLQYGTTYNITVRVKMNGIWGDYGDTCTLLLNPQPEATNVVPSSCGLDYVNPSSQFISAAIISGATQYEWEFVGGGETFVFTTPSYNLLIFQPVLSDISYGVRVRAFAGGVWGSYDASCDITINGGLGLAQNVTKGHETVKIDHPTLKIYPNPNAGEEVILEISKMSEKHQKITIELIDVFGSVVQNESYASFGKTQRYNWLFDKKLASGMYYVNMYIGDAIITEKIIIQ